ncbi:MULTISPECIES: tonB-system energizer ExbB [unclassified Bradyrhizobium]|uniref:tonB-system energizer ExbB n=1 Tax=unclassified Bradyrhizobium TaxID=2631580 RepID=UPI002479478F|nr:MULTISPECIES: tonB-system energizer ExbB [unclassified Bradyrhizobium]WGR68466.1 tonB-system energizer ExbB [Bradyrhizobium sp. ISRA426]WGR80521.1 tonB-system energizer ExbB [Bradyrhizobium sp. ISRA430]WGR83706.1 tonB-system energizer ExbB [Bradyrhizobium sp. ISRA432]
MKTSSLQASLAAAVLMAATWLASPVSAQQQAQPAAPAPATAPQPAAGPAPTAPQPSAVAPAVPPTAAPAAPMPAASTPAAATPAASPADAPAAPAPEAASADPGSRTLKSTAPAMKELSPWVMFMSADVIVKAVMIGLAFASLVTWTVFIAKSIELSVASSKLRSALKKVAEARSLAEAQMALGTKQGILPSFLAAALREARMSAGLSSDAGIKERAASSFAEIVRAEQRRIRIGMGVLATIGSTSPFVGLFGTVWGIMNSFIGISKSQTTNLAVVAPGIAEALLATAIGLVAAIPAVIIYNHFSRVTKSYLELVSRASGVSGRLLSRDLDRTHGTMHSRAAE